MVTTAWKREFQNNPGSFLSVVTDITFDSSYPQGGESVTLRQLGLSVMLRNLQVTGAPSGYSFGYNPTTKKLQVFRPGPVVVTEATGTFTAGVAYTLKKIPGYILAIRGTAGSTGVKRIIPSTKTPGANQVAVNWTTGVMTWGDAAITAATIVYVPRGVPGFTTDLLVVEESVTVGPPSAVQVGTLANRAAAICAVWNNEDDTLMTYVPVGETPTGSSVAIDINNSGNTIITVPAATISDGAAKLIVTYLKFTGNPLTAGLNWRDQADWTVTSDTVGPGTDAAWDVAGLVIPGFGQQIVGETGAAANLQAILVDAAGATAANVAVWDPSRNTISFLNADSYVTIEIPLLYFSAEMFGTITEEVPDGTDLSFLSAIRFVAEGR
mgnify:CR=1 FL=1